MGKHVLVTGGCGFIGSHTVELLLNQGHTVIVLDDLSTGTLENLTDAQAEFGNALKIVIGSTTDTDMVEKLVSQVDVILNLAALVSVGISVKTPRESFIRNAYGFVNVLEAARKFNVNRVVYASSAAVYGDTDGPQLEMRNLMSPLSPYGADKCANELYAGIFSKLYGIKTVGLRYFNVYGPRQDPKSDYAGVIGKFIDRGLNGQPITIYGDGNQTRNFVNVLDVARINVAALIGSEGFGKTPIENLTVNVGCKVGTHSQTSVNRLAELINLSLSEPVEITHVSGVPGDIRHSTPDLTNISNLAPEIVSSMIPLEVGLSKLVDYLKEQT